MRFAQTVALSGLFTDHQNLEALRRITFRDRQTGKVMLFLTNNLTEPALTIAQLYRSLWLV